jgi:hypothetical protein
MTRERVMVATKVDTEMTNVQAAAKLTQLYGEYVAKLRFNNQPVDSEYAEAVAIAVMALKTDED